MATQQEITEALLDFQVQCNENERLRRMQRDWTKIIHMVAEDNDSRHTMTVVAGETTKVEEGLHGTPDIIVTTSSETLCDMFWGDLNPAQKYLRGELKLKASQEDVMRLDAINLIIWPED
jgi:putative sterol carrier protein